MAPTISAESLTIAEGPPRRLRHHKVPRKIATSDAKRRCRIPPSSINCRGISPSGNVQEPPLPESISRAAVAIVANNSGRSFSSTDEKATRMSRSPSAITPTPCFSSKCLRKVSESMPLSFKHMK